MYGEPATELSALQQEWAILQNQFDSYEKYSLIIKLTAVVLCALAIWFAKSATWSFLLVAILWLQDGIWKTFQQRIYARLILVEKAISEGQSYKAMQFNSSWQDARAGYSSLLSEYLSSAAKPTVAFPYAVLLLCLILF